jgi:hypothetical protein
MKDLQKGLEVLRRAETDLCNVIAAAAKGGEYDELKIIADWAKQLSALIGDQKCLAARPADEQSDVTKHANAPHVGDVAGIAAPVSTRTALRSVATRTVRPRLRSSHSNRKRRSATARQRSRSSDRDYPIFLRQNESLVKIGWSRKWNAQYEHRAAKRVMELLVESALKVGCGGNRFVMEQLLPLVDGDQDVPSYQAYLTLAWLRIENLLDRHGRQGYSVPDAENLRSLVMQRWNKLTER